jgi:hypothetical protein
VVEAVRGTTRPACRTAEPQSRCVVRQHDADGTHPDGPRASCGVGNRDRRGGASDAGPAVVRRHPVSATAERLGVARQVDADAQRLPAVSAFGGGQPVSTENEIVRAL